MKFNWGAYDSPTRYLSKKIPSGIFSLLFKQNHAKQQGVPWIDAIGGVRAHHGHDRCGKKAFTKQGLWQTVNLGKCKIKSRELRYSFCRPRQKHLVSEFPSPHHQSLSPTTRLNFFPAYCVTSRSGDQQRTAFVRQHHEVHAHTASSYRGHTLKNLCIYNSYSK